MMRSLTFVLLCAPALQAADPPSVADLVTQLGDPRFAVRERAQKELLSRGERIVPELEKLARGADAETVERIGKLRYALVGYKDDIKRLLSEVHEGLDSAPTPVSDELRGLIAAHQPGAGDLLLSVLANPEHALHRRAVRTFVATWDVATVDQIDAYVRQAVTLNTTHRPKFPAKVGAMISFEAQLRDGWTGWPNLAAQTFSFMTRTTRYLDGKPYDKPFDYRYPFATVGWYRLGELAEGKHTIHAVMEYEFTQNGQKRKGEIQSKDSTFEIVSASTPDDLIAAKSVEVAKHVRAAFDVRGVQRVGSGSDVFEIKGGLGTDPPQVSWEAAGGGRAGIRCIDWHVASPLTVDLCFEAEIHDIKTGKIYLADPILITGNATGRGYLVPRDPRAFAKDREGMMAVKVVLKPSRALALTDTRMKRYFPDEITTPEMWMKVYPKIDPQPIIRR